MQNFVFQNYTKIIFGQGTIAALSTEIPKGKRVMMTYGGGSIKANGVYNSVMEALRGFHVVEFAGIEPNPHYETLMKAVELAKKEKVDYFLAVGGGSVIDGTKFIATAMLWDGEPWDFVQNENLAVDALPLAAVLTLPATGSEMNSGAVISRKSTGEKLAFHNPSTFPQFSIVDPEVAYSLPKRQISNGIVDTFVHIMEQYLTYPADAMVMDRFAEGLLLTLSEIGADLYKDHRNYSLMSNFMITATMGLNGFIAMGVPQDWATHMIGHELTAYYALDHAVTLAVVYPALLRVMREEKRAKLLQYASRVWGICTGTEDQRIDEAIRRTEQFFESVGIPARLRRHNCGDEHFDAIVKRFENRKWALGENRSVTPDKIRQILELSL